MMERLFGSRHIRWPANMAVVANMRGGTRRPLHFYLNSGDMSEGLKAGPVDRVSTRFPSCHEGPLMLPCRYEPYAVSFRFD